MISKKIILILILILAFGLRFYKITDVPPSLNWDEVSIGYNAYSILKTGKDEWGQTLPLFFRSYGEYKLPAQIYASIPGIYFFGLNELGVRITPVVYGVLTVLLLFFLARALFKSEFVGQVAAFLLAISPWHIQLTRASFESSFAAFWIVLGTWFLVKGIKDHIFLVLAAIPFAFSVYTYNTARVFTPLFIFIFLLLFHNNFIKLKKIVALSALLFVVILLPMVPFTLSGAGSARYKLVSITDDKGLIPRINENRGNSNLPNILPTLVHNKYTYIGFYFAQNYLAHFTPDYLFFNGAPHKQHHVQNIGELYIFQAPFLLIGLYLLFRKKNKFRWVLLSWILIAHLPVATTNDSIPHALRNLIAAPAYQLITAYGIYKSYIFLKKQKKFQNFGYHYLLVIVISIASVLQFQNYLENYYLNYSKKYSRDWQYGYKQAVNYINQNKHKYDEIVFTRHYGEPHMFTLFYSQYDPAKYQNNPNLARYETNDWVWVTNFDKFYFPDMGDKGTKYVDIIIENKGKKLLFIAKPNDLPPELPRLKRINFLNGQPAFEIVEHI